MKHRLYLILDFARRDLRERYIGTSMGKVWFLLSPLVTILIYTVVFSDFMKMKLQQSDVAYSYSIFLVAGLLAWNAFQTTVLRLNTSILDRAPLIRKISVPVYIFQAAILLAESLPLLISYLLAIAFLLIVGHPVTEAIFYLFPLFALQMLFSFALGAFFSLLTPFFEDLREALPIVMQLWFWMTPIVYVPEMLAHRFPALLTWNPFYLYAESYQGILLDGVAPPQSRLLLMLLIDLALLSLVAWLYKKMIPTIKDLL